MPSAPGLESDESVAAWLWDHGVAAVAADNIGVEALPFSRTSVETWLHYRLIAMLGMALGELWDLDALTRDCRDDGRWEGLLVASPLHAPGGSGSPANAMALK
jgi:kynurenine formamidase